MELATTLKRLGAVSTLAVVAAIASGAHADTTPTVAPTHDGRPTAPLPIPSEPMTAWR